MRIITLSITPYKEKDAIINAISEEGEISFLVNGALNIKSKNSALNNQLVIADIELKDGNFKYPVLKSSNIIETPLKVKNDYYYLSSLYLLTEATKELLQEDEKQRIFNSLIQAIINLKTAESPWAIVLSYLAKVLKESGYEFAVNNCVFCGAKNDIVTFSFNDGGFVCRNCLEEEMERDLTKNQMLIIRAAFNVKDISEATFNIGKEDALVVLNKFMDFIKDSYGVTLKSIALLNK